MHELVVHVEQVLVHETVVASHFPIELARLVVAAPSRTQGSGLAVLGKHRITREDEDQTIYFAGRIAPDARRQPFLLLTQVRHAHALATTVIRPAVVVTLEL